MKFPLTRAGVLLLALVVALAGIGIGHGAWTDTLTITGTGSTGGWGGPDSLGSWGFTEQSKFLYDAYPTNYTVDDGGTSFTALAHNSGSSTVSNHLPSWLGYYDDAGTLSYFKRIDVTLVNAYPGYADELAYKVVNAGELDILVTDMYVEYQLDRTGGPLRKSLNPYAGAPGSPHVAKAELDLDDEGDIDLTLWNFDMIGQTLTPGKILTSHLVMRVEDGVAQDITDVYKFIVYIEGTLVF